VRPVTCLKNDIWNLITQRHLKLNPDSLQLSFFTNGFISLLGLVARMGVTGGTRICNRNVHPISCCRFVHSGNLVHYWCRSLMLLLLIWQWSNDEHSNYLARWSVFQLYTTHLLTLLQWRFLTAEGPWRNFSTRFNWRQGLGFVPGVEHCFLLQFAYALSFTRVIY